jgi:Alpha-2-macroglobulin family
MSPRKRRSRRFVSPFVGKLLLEVLEERQLLSGEVGTITPLINLTTPTYFQEGNTFTVNVDNGTPDANFTVQVIGDNNTVQYAFPTGTTDDSGHASVQLQMPDVLGPNYTVDGRTISVTQGDTTQNFSVTVHAGLSVSLTTPPTFREGDPFTVNLNNGIPNTNFTVDVIGDNNTVQYSFIVTGYPVIFSCNSRDLKGTGFLDKSGFKSLSIR